jgi:hypothetical protein
MENKITLPEGFSDLGEKIKTISIDDIKTESGEDKIHYPCLYFSGKEKLKNLPKSGTAMIHFKKVMEREEEVTRNGETKENYTVELEIHGIKPMESDEYSEQEMEEDDDETAIDKGLEAAEENNEDKEDED